MKAITSAQMRELDKLATSEFAIPSVELMRRAGDGVASIVADIADRARLGNSLIQVIAGRGNNGGDAFVAALYLHEEDFDVEVLLAATAGDIRGDSLLHFSKMRTAGVPVRELPTKDDWEDALANASAGQILVDGVLGIGISGPPRGPMAAAIHYINVVAEDNAVISIDLPSGLNADTGESPGETVVADVTATIGIPKQGLLAAAAVPYVGSLDVVSIGIPVELTSRYQCRRELITGWDIRRNFRRKPHNSHKGMNGHVLVIGGAVGYAGAPVMAAQAAQRAGAGLVSLLVPRSVYPVAAGSALEIMVHPGPDTATGSLGIEAWDAWKSRLKEFDAVVVGPGMTRHADTALWVHNLLRECKCPLLLDADALNVLEGNPGLVARSRAPVVITPHPGEMARLLGCKAADLQTDREGAAEQAAKLTGAVVVLKGAGTIVAQKGQTPQINLTGNPGMATGGMGDVLSGIIGSFMAQGITPIEAAKAGVFVHGRAGDNAAWRSSQTGLSPIDVIEELPYVFREIAAR